MINTTTGGRAVLIHANEMGPHHQAIYIGREHSGRGRGPSFKRSPFANPFNHNEYGRAEAVALFASWIAGDPTPATLVPWPNWHPPSKQDIRAALAGTALACWCPRGQPCHGNILAAIADGMEPAAAAVGHVYRAIAAGDCIAGMEKLAPASVDLVVADPPYNIGIDYGTGSSADELPADRYVAWTRAWIAAAARALKPNGTMFVICGQEYGAHHDLAIQAAGLTIRNRITWYETFGVNCRTKFNRTSRPVFYAVKNAKQFTFNRGPVTVPSARQTKYGDKRAAAGGKLLDDVWMIPRVCGTFHERRTYFDTATKCRRPYPTQLPEELVQRLILFASNPGELVLDPFVGSGTTAALAARYGRRFIGWDLNSDYAAGARERVAQVVGSGDTHTLVAVLRVDDHCNGG